MTRTSKPDEPWIQLGITEEQWHKREAKAQTAAEGRPSEIGIADLGGDVDLIDGQDDAAHPQQIATSTPEIRTRKQRSDKGKPKAVKQAAPTADLNKRKHLALLEKYYALLDKRDALDASLEQVRAEINAQLTQ